MINIVGTRKIWYAVSGIVVAASIALIALFGFKLGIDFTGGALIELQYTKGQPSPAEVVKILDSNGLTGSVVQPLGNNELLLRTKPLSPEQHEALIAGLKKQSGDSSFVEVRFETIGPTISSELRQKSLNMILAVVVAIILYLSWAFRSVSKPVSSWKYGLIAVSVLLHDVLVPAGVFALLGHLYGIEIDTLFVTAMLTVMGFSVHDTIVVFDRIRESLDRNNSTTFEDTVNFSINTTIPRTINTSMTTMIALFSLFFLGGETTKYFSLTMIIGIFVGTYSSIFIASPLLVTWHKLQTNK